MKQEQQQICDMFDRIACTYDLSNRILSCGQDIRWRNKLCSFVPADRDIKVLDVATGTADILLAMAHKCPNISEGHGVDLATHMLSLGQQKINKLGLIDKLRLSKADACALPFESSSFDLVSISFGIRNIPNKEAALSEMRRVLKPDGLLLVMEFSLPEILLIKKLYLAYFRHVLPRLGGLLSGHHEAYRYLNTTVEGFVSPEQFKLLLVETGFRSVQMQKLSLGIATIYCARVS